MVHVEMETDEERAARTFASQALPGGTIISTDATIVHVFLATQMHSAAMRSGSHILVILPNRSLSLFLSSDEATALVGRKH